MPRTPSCFVAAALAAALLLAPRAASALIPIPVGGHPKELDVFARVTLERGLVEPNENVASYQPARWEMYTFGGGYGLGHFGVFQDLSVRAEVTGYRSPAEVNDLSRGAVNAAQCAGVVAGPGLCEFHPSDSGAFFTPSISTSLVHTAKLSFGVFVVGNIPVGVRYEKFVLPRIDYVGGGFRAGMEFEPWFALETSFYVGSGSPRPGSSRQNGTFAATQLLHFRTGRIGGSSLFFKLGLKVGPYVDGDLIGERTDARYDQAYTAGFPDRSDRIRMFRFAATALPYVQVSDKVSVELGYLQKLFGYDTPATQLYTATLRYVF
jgi:hypothetical protein